MFYYFNFSFHTLIIL